MIDHQHPDGSACSDKCKREVKLMDDLMSSVGAKAAVVSYWMDNGQMTMEIGGAVMTRDALKRFLAGALFGLTAFSVKQGFSVEELSEATRKAKVGDKYFY